MFLLLSTLFCFSAQAATTAPDLDALSKKILRLEPTAIRVSDEPDFQFFKVGENTWLIGLKQIFRVHTSVSKFSNFLANPKSYIGLFNGVKEAHLDGRKKKNRYDIYTQTALPIPFMKPDETTMRYELKRQGSKILYKISLAKSKALTSYSGLLMLAPLKGGNCLVYRLDFMEPSLGIAKLLGQEKIWSESAITALQADRAIKLFLEHPDWPTKKINQASNDSLDDFRVRYRQLYAAREAFEENKAIPSLEPKKAKSKKKS